MKPTLHLTSWPSKTLHGPGRRWTIMALPRPWELGDGHVFMLTPWQQWVRDAMKGVITIEQYRGLYSDLLLAHARLAPGELCAVAEEPWGRVILVEDGDSLLCACARDKAAAGECHRVWAAEALVKAGWRVILDGREVEA